VLAPTRARLAKSAVVHASADRAILHCIGIMGAANPSGSLDATSRDR
jgi:hypothetical protein